MQRNDLDRLERKNEREESFKYEVVAVNAEIPGEKQLSKLSEKKTGQQKICESELQHVHPHVKFSFKSIKKVYLEAVSNKNQYYGLSRCSFCPS